MIQRFLTWLGSFAHPVECTRASEAARQDAEKRLADEAHRTRAAEEVGDRARKSLARNGYSQALRRVYGGH